MCVANSRALELAGIGPDTQAPYNVEILREGNGEPTGVFLDRSYAPVIEYTLFRCVPRITYEDRVAGCRLGAAGVRGGGHHQHLQGARPHAPRSSTPTGASAKTATLRVRAHLPLSVPGASVDDRRLAQVVDEWGPRLGHGGSGDDMLRFEGICVDVANEKTAAIIGEDYPYEAWAGHFYHSLTHERFVKIGVHAARLGIRLSCLICYELERVLRAYEAINEAVPIRDKRWVMVHVIEATDDQIARMKRLGGHRDGDAQLHVHGERSLQSSGDRRAGDPDPPAPRRGGSGVAVVGQRSVFDAVDDVGGARALGTRTAGGGWARAGSGVRRRYG